MPAPVTGERLTAREQQVLTDMADGLTADQIATKLHLAESTIRTYLAAIRIKLGARNRPHAVHLGHTTGYLGGSR